MSLKGRLDIFKNVIGLLKRSSSLTLTTVICDVLYQSFYKLLSKYTSFRSLLIAMIGQD